MKRNEMRRAALWAPLLILIPTAALVCWRVYSRTSSAGPASPAPNPEVTRRFLELEAQRNQLDQTVWSKELLAQKFEGTFVRLWDELRSASNAAAVLAEFPFGRMVIGTPNDPAPTENPISVQRLADPTQILTPESWRQWFEKFRRDDYRLEQSEWRQTQFDIDTNGAAHSRLALTLHVVKPKPEERFIVRGSIEVDWRRTEKLNTEAPLEPFPERIVATDLELVSRRGETPFEHKVVAQLASDPRSGQWIEPNLQVYDLDGDGLSEIILAAPNRVYWNKGKGAFNLQPLVAQPAPEMKAWLIADFDGDGAADFLAAGTSGLALFRGDQRGQFMQAPKRIRIANQPLPNPMVLTAGDIDRDGDLDVWLAQYKVPYQDGQMPAPYYDANDGFPSFLLENDGAGNFHDATEKAGLSKKRFRRTYSSSFVDLDGDGDLDLVVVSDFAGVDLYFNDGSGHFTDVTPQLVDESHAFGMALTCGDYDLDGGLDFLAIGMNSPAADRLEALQLGPPGFDEFHRMRPKMTYGNRLYFQRNGRWVQTPISEPVARTGWSWGAVTGDFDNDGDPDIYVANGHISGASAQDYESQFWRHDVYLAGPNDPARELYFRSVRTKHQGAGQSYGGFEKNRLFLNVRGTGFLEAGYLMGVSAEDDCRNAVVDDLDGDGKLELLVTTFQTWPTVRQALHLFPNFTAPSGHWIGIRLRESGPGLSPIGAKVIVHTPAGTQFRQFVTGDSYRSQHSTTAHFGLGRETEVRRVEVIWPNGRRRILLNPPVDRYHTVKPE